MSSVGSISGRQLGIGSTWASRKDFVTLAFGVSSRYVSLQMLSMMDFGGEDE